jgi:Apoptosis regulator proteins, Bcl-2 family
VLEAMHTKIYTNVSRQLSSSPSDLESAEDAAVLLTTFGRILFKSEVNWGLIISLFNVTAALSIDLVRQNHEDYIPTLIEGFLGVIEDELIPFLSDGGWINLHLKLQNRKQSGNHQWSLVLVLLAIFVFFFLLNNYLLKF